MPGWFTPSIVVLAVAALVFLVLFWTTRKRKHFAGLAVSLVLIGVVWLIAALVPTDRRAIKSALDDTIAGIGASPTEYVDITSVIDTKRRMLRCHASQFKAVSELASQDIQEVMEVQARFRGLAAGCAFAEGFSRLDAWQRGLTRRILPSVTSPELVP